MSSVWCGWLPTPRRLNRATPPAAAGFASFLLFLLHSLPTVVPGRSSNKQWMP